MKYLIKKDKLKRKLVKKYELKRLVLKSVINNEYLKLNIRHYAFTCFKKFPNNSIINRVKNRCILTGRSRSIFTHYKISRYMFKIILINKKLSGFIHRIW